MTSRKLREALRLILTGSICIRPGSVYDAISIRIAEDLGFELGMFGGSVASLAVLGGPDVVLIALTELAEQMRRMSRAASLPVLVDADHGYGNALNVRRTVEELEITGAAGLTIEDTLLPQSFGQTGTQLISLEEGVGKMRPAASMHCFSPASKRVANWKRFRLRRSCRLCSAARPTTWPTSTISQASGCGSHCRATRRSPRRRRPCTRRSKRCATV